VSIYSISPELASIFERSGIDPTVFPVPADCKDPSGRANSKGERVASIIRLWQLDCSNSPAQIERWRSENQSCNWGLACAETGIIGVEVDPKARRIAKDPNSEQAGFQRAGNAWIDLLASWGLPILAPHVRSRSGGMHYYFRPPPEIDVRTLTQRSLVTLPGWGQACVDTRVRGFLIIPPSRFAGQDYSMWHCPPDRLYEAPAGLIAALSEQPRRARDGVHPTTTIKPGSYDLEEFLGVVLRIQAAGGFAYDHRRNLLWIVKAEWGEDLSRQLAEHLHDGNRNTDYLIDAILRHGSDEYKDGDARIQSIFKLAHEMAVPCHVVSAFLGFDWPLQPPGWGGRSRLSLTSQAVPLIDVSQKF
jgi:hypothetical protein